MKLNPVETTFVYYFFDMFEGVVDEQAHDIDEGGKPVNDF